MRERKHEQEAPSVALDNRFSHNVPDLSSTEGGSEVQAQRTVAERPAEMPPECVSEGDPIGKDARDTARLWKSKGECRYPGITLGCANLL